MIHRKKGKEGKLISEFAVLVIIILGGMMVGVCYDFYRILRWRLGLNKVLTLIGDLIFSFVALCVLFFFAQKANFLEFRFYLFVASLLGLLLYLRFFSSDTKKAFNFLLSLIAGIKNIITRTMAAIFKSGVRIVTILMRVPYGILRWLALLLFRIGEAVGRNGWKKMKRNTDQNPKEK